MSVDLRTPKIDKHSPWSATQTHGKFMGYYVHRSIPPHGDDIEVILDDHRFVARPDLLAHEFYADAKLWWVFGVRNALEDPVHDLKYGTTIWIPSPNYIKEVI